MQDYINAQNKSNVETVSDNKFGLDSDIANEFDQWSKHIQQAPPKVEQPKF